MGRPADAAAAPAPRPCDEPGAAADPVRIPRRPSGATRSRTRWSSFAETGSPRSSTSGGSASPRPPSSCGFEPGSSPARAFARALYEETEGNPFFVEEIIRHLIEAGVQVGSASASELQRFGLPEGVKQVIAFRLGRLEAPAAELLRVAAVIGRDIDAALLERVVQLDRGGVPRRARGGARSRAAGRVRRQARELPVLARADPGDAVREHVGAAAGAHPQAGRRGDRGRAGAPAASATCPSSPTTSRAPRDPEDAEKAITYAFRAGEQATTMLAHEEAAEHYARALDVQGRFQPEASERRCELLLRARRGPRPGRRASARVLRLPRGGRAGRAARRRRRAGARRDRGLAPIRAAARRGRHRADRDDRAGARARARAVAGPGASARVPVRRDLLLARSGPDAGAQRRGDRRSRPSWGTRRHARTRARRGAGCCGTRPTWPSASRSRPRC